MHLVAASRREAGRALAQCQRKLASVQEEQQFVAVRASERVCTRGVLSVRVKPDGCGWLMS